MRHTSLLHPIHHRHHGLPLLAMAVLFALAVLLWFEPWRGDGYAPVFHGTLFASLATSGDLDLINEYLMSSNPLRVAEQAAFTITPEGYVTDAFPIGPTLLWTPFWLVAHMLAQWMGPETTFDPVAPVYTFAFSFAGLFYGFLGFLLLWRVTYRFFSSPLAFAGAVAAFFGTTAPDVCFKESGFSHVYAFFTVALFLYATTECARWSCPRRVLYLALAAGLMVITYWPAAVFLIIPAAVLLRPDCVGPLRRRISRAEAEEKETAPPENEPEASPDLPMLDLSPPLDQISLPPSPDLPPGKAEQRGGLLLFLARGIVFLVVFLLALSPQFLVWDKVFGDYLLFPSSPQTPPSPGGGLAGAAWVQWKAAMLGTQAGLLRLYPVAVLSLFGLLVMALRRSAAGVAICVSVALFTVVDNLPWQWLKLENAGPGRYALLAPFVAIGLAQFCDEMRSRGTRILVALCIVAVACWTLVAAMARRHTHLYASAWPGDSSAWPLALPEMLRHPLAFVGDSLLIRYVSQGTPRLESMVFLLFLVLLIPSITWLGLRHALPIVRRWSLMKVLSWGSLASILLFDLAVLRSGLPPEQRSGNLKLREELQGLPALPLHRPASLENKPTGEIPSDPELLRLSKALREVVEGYPDCPAATLLLAEIQRACGDTAGARDLYHRLAQLGLRAGELGLLETARTRQETLEALDLVTRREQGNLEIALSILEKYRANGLTDRARDYLDRIFPPSAVYWRLRAQLTPEDPALALQYLKRALSYAPTDPVLRRAVKEEEKKQRAAARPVSPPAPAPATPQAPQPPREPGNEAATTTAVSPTPAPAPAAGPK